MRARLATALLLLCSYPTAGQEAGWHFSPLPGEGDRAAMGCSDGADTRRFTCLVVRCEDDWTTGIHIHTSRTGGDAGRWELSFDKGEFRYDVTAVPDGSPYGARIEGDIEPILAAIKTGAMVYLDREDGADIDRGLSLSGSLYAVNRALYFCAPKADSEPQATRNPPSTGSTAPVM